MGRPAAAAVAALCGVAGGCLYLAVVSGVPGAFLLIYLMQLPLFAAGLWLGTGAAAIAGIAAIVVLLAASDLMATAWFAMLGAVPVVILVRQALLARRGRDGEVTWYPPGLLTAWLTGLALAGLGGAFVLFGGPAGLLEQLRGVIDEALQRLAYQGPLSRTEVAGALALVTPGVIAGSWMAMTITSGTLAQGLLARFRLNWRPAPDLAALDLPLWITVALGLAIGLTLLGGTPRFIGLNAAIALSVPFCLAGLAVLHAATRRLTHPAMALVVFYTMAALFGWPLLIAAVLGLCESWLGLRRRLASDKGRLDG